MACLGLSGGEIKGTLGVREWQRPSCQFWGQRVLAGERDQALHAEPAILGDVCLGRGGSR